MPSSPNPSALIETKPRHEPEPASHWARLHQALMPDYNRRASACWWAMVAAGGTLLIACLAQLAQEPPRVWLEVAVGMALAMLAGLFPVRVPGTRNSFVASDIFIFVLLLLHGPAAAAVAVAGEAAMGSLRTSKRWTSRIASPAIGTVAIVAAGTLLEALRASFVGPGTEGIVALMALAMGTALLYFLLSAVLFAGVLRLKRGEPFFQLGDAIGVFRWVGMAYAGSAALATLLVVAYQQAGLGVWMVMLPLLGMLLVTLHFYFRQQESAQALRERSAAAEAREAEANAREAEARARHLRELQASERRFHGAFAHASIGMALLAFDGRILQTNPALQQLLALPADALAGQRMQDFVPAEHAAMLVEQFGRAGRAGPFGTAIDAAPGTAVGTAVGAAELEESPGLPFELPFVRPDGSTPWAAVHCATFTEPETGEPCLILQAQDVTARRVAEAGLQHLAFHDTLTGLPNRRRFIECLEGAVARARVDTAYAYAVMFLDFDRFKLVNDSLGHGAGDELLVQLARRLQERLRPSDIVARLGGDEFALLTERIGHERDAVALAGRLMDALRAPFTVAGQELQASASIGITFGSQGYSSAEAVLRDADTAMYKAKSEGRARVAIFDGSLHTEVSRRLRIEGELRRAIDNGDLSVAYQPVFDLTHGKLIALEALVRWRHPSEGALLPAAFLPIAEESGLMRRVSDFMLHAACRQVRSWQLSHPAWAELSVNVNVAAEDLSQPGFVTRVQTALIESGLRAEHLTLELTENILMSRIEGAFATLSELRRLGVRVAVDDFGTGYSSLSHLAQLPIDVLKIDRSFVADLTTDADQAAVVRAIVHLGQSLRKSIIAEGIESSRQVEQLLAMGCKLGQGHHLAKPLDVESAGELLRRDRPSHQDIHLRQRVPRARRHACVRRRDHDHLRKRSGDREIRGPRHRAAGRLPRLHHHLHEPGHGAALEHRHPRRHTAVDAVRHRHVRDARVGDHGLLAQPAAGGGRDGKRGVDAGRRALTRR